MLNLNPYRAYGYCEAYPDLVGALDYITANDFEGPVIVWGSSYSASLAIQLAAKNGTRIDGVLAFSPASGGPMAACRPEPYLGELEMPLLVLRPSSELQIDSVKDQFERVEQAGHQTYEAENGVHGSSMIVADRVEGSVEKHWTAVLSFIEKVVE